MSDLPYSCHMCGLLSVNGPDDERRLLVTRAALVGALESGACTYEHEPRWTIDEIIAALAAVGVRVEG